MRESLDKLCSLCREQVQRFRRNEPYDDRFCMEIFRRAVVERDGDCWRELQTLYHPQVIAWCRRSGSSSSVGLDDLAALAWEKFWLNFGPNQFSQAGSTAKIQSYLKACVYSTFIDVSREQRAAISIDRPNPGSSDESLTLADSLEDSAPTPEESVVEQSTRQAFREIITRHATDETERVLLHLKYELGLSSAAVQTKRPDLFPSVADVYRVTRNLLDRLRRSPELRKWFVE